MKDIIVIFPIDLYDDLSNLKDKQVFIVEEQIYFDRSSSKLGNLKFNILKPIYHRATMMSYYNKLQKLNINCIYIELNTNWIKTIKLYKYENIYFYNPVDHILEKKIKDNFKDYHILDTSRFILNKNDILLYNGVLKQTSFYIWMRKKYDILMKDNKPIGNKMTYDTDNRKPPTKNIINELPMEKNYSSYIKDSISYIKKNIKIIIST